MLSGCDLQQSKLCHNYYPKYALKHYNLSLKFLIHDELFNSRYETLTLFLKCHVTSPYYEVVLLLEIKLLETLTLNM